MNSPYRFVQCTAGVVEKARDTDLRSVWGSNPPKPLLRLAGKVLVPSTVTPVSKRGICGVNTQRSLLLWHRKWITQCILVHSVRP